MRNVARIRYTTGQAPQEDVLQADVERTMLKQQELDRASGGGLLESRSTLTPEPAP